ncbi:MAG TPA: acetate--CoA ligase family protein [Candidatus Competibacteraceae bacterium]|nr:acetate--CoA ligase family protein [Gammaproteobacteria bacterium]HPF59308.1 acetate--CoA ligase family protein [Candidatus Competibacteraceae bacterium]
MNSPLHQFLAPGSIAIIGASLDPAKRGYRALAGLLNDGYAGKIYPIHPKLEAIMGLKAYPSIEQVPEPVDLALICTPAKTLPGILELSGRNGVKGAVILASGFGEAGEAGVRLERETLEAAQRSGVRIIGPNTSGMFNLHKKVNLLALDGVKPGNVGIVSQSGNMLLALVLEAQHKGHIGFSTYVGPGNQTDIGFADYLRYLSEEANTQVAALYVEGFKNGHEFLRVARETARKKPVVVYKSGSTAAGQKAASSHTGALAGSYAMTVDLLRQAGVNVVGKSGEILPVAEGLGLLQQAAGRRIAILADGGGQATIASDRLSEAGLQLAGLEVVTQERLRAVLFPQASLANPIDVAGSTDAHPRLLADCAGILCQDCNVDQVFLVGMFGGYGIRFAQELAGQELDAAKELAAIKQQSGKPLIVYSLYAPLKPEPLEVLRGSGIPVYDSIEHAVEVLAALSERGEFAQRDASAVYAEPMLPDPAMQQMIVAARQAGRDLLEPEAKDLLAAYGIDVPPQRVLSSVADLDTLDPAWLDRPVAMKVVSKDILHKSDAGGVKLNLQGRDALHAAYMDIMASCRTCQADADIAGVLLTPMVRKGIEVIIGVSRDPIFGPVMMFGLGGIFVEILEDIAFRSIPLSRQDAESMVNQIKARKILEGARGAAGVSKEALVALILKVAGIVEAHPEIAEIDLNPLMAYPDGYAVVDARMILDRVNERK